MARYGSNHKGGRPKGLATIAHEASKARIAELVVENIDPIANALIRAAKGVRPMEGEMRPDVFAAKELFERAFGKVTDKLQIQEVKKLLSFED
jgi:hypothetical protein